MESITRGVQAVLNKTPGAVEALGAQVRTLEGHAPGAIKGLGLIASIAGAASGWAGFNEAELKDKVRTIGDTLQLGGEGGMLALQVLGVSEQSGALKNLLGRTGAGGAIVSAFAEGINAIQSFVKGKFEEGVVSGMSALGGALLGASAFTSAMAVPVIGVLLSLGGLIGGLILGNREYRQELEDAEAFLTGAGVDGAAAKRLIELRSHGPFIAELARVLNTQPTQLLEHLSKLSPEQLSQFTQMAMQVPKKDKDGQVTFDETAANDALFSQEKDPGVDRTDHLEHGIVSHVRVPIWPASLKAAATWMYSHGMEPPLPPVPLYARPR
jgi:hypothetical protein